MNEEKLRVAAGYPTQQPVPEMDKSKSVHYMLNQIVSAVEDNGMMIEGSRRWEDSLFYDAKKESNKSVSTTPARTPDTVIDKLQSIYNMIVENNDQLRMHRNVLEGALLPV